MNAPGLPRATEESRAVMAEVHDLDSLRLDEAAHDIDRSIVTVEKRCGRDKTQWDLFRVSRYAGDIAGKRTHRMDLRGKTAKNIRPKEET